MSWRVIVPSRSNTATAPRRAHCSGAAASGWPPPAGVRAVIAQSYERIHRSNLIGMGVLPLQFVDGATAASLGLTGREVFDVVGIQGGAAKTVTVVAKGDGGRKIEFKARVRIDTPKELEYYRHGGILQYVLRSLVGKDQAA